MNTVQNYKNLKVKGKITKKQAILPKYPFKIGDFGTDVCIIDKLIIYNINGIDNFTS